MEEIETIREAAAQCPGLKLFVLYGSRARGDFLSRSDWDLGYLAGPGFDPDDLLARLVLTLGTERIDLVNLARASALLRFRAASEGRPLFEAEAKAFQSFQIEAALFWCDMGPVIRQAYELVLKRIVVRSGGDTREKLGA